MPALPPLLDAPAAHPHAADSGLVAHLARRFLQSHLASKPPSPLPGLVRRQSYQESGYIPLVYQGLNSGPAPGTVVGIVLGSVAGFLIIVWLLYTLTNLSGRNAIAGEEEIVVRERRPHTPRSRRSRRSSRPEVREISRSPRRVVVEERRTSMPPPHPRPRSRSVLVEERVTQERRVDGDDIVEVIEEHSPPRRHRTRRDGGYRSVDPELYAGGEYPQHHVPRGRSGSRYSKNS